MSAMLYVSYTHTTGLNRMRTEGRGTLGVSKKGGEERTEGRSGDRPKTRLCGGIKRLRPATVCRAMCTYIEKHMYIIYYTLSGP